MPALSLGDNVLVTKNGRLHGQLIQSMFGYVVTEMTGVVSMDTAFTQLNLAICANGEVADAYNRCCPDNYIPGDIWYQVIRPTRFRKFVKADFTTGVTSGFAATAPNVACVITRVGELGRRDNISSLHLPAATDNGWIDGGTVTLAAQVKLATMSDACRTTYSVAIGSTKFSPSILNGPLAAQVTPITFAFFQFTSRVMRRRTLGVGE